MEIQAQNNENVNQDNLLLANQAYFSKLSNFLFCVSTEGAQRCCCGGCSIKISLIIFSILCLVWTFIQILMIKNGFQIPIVIITLVLLLGYILIIVSLCNNKVSYAYSGYIINLCLFFIQIILYIIIVILEFTNPPSPPTDSSNNNPTPGRGRGFNGVNRGYVLIIQFLIEIILCLYDLYLIFSYCKLLAECNFNGINGKFYEEDGNNKKIVPGEIVIPGTYNKVAVNNNVIALNNLNNMNELTNNAIAIVRQKSTRFNDQHYLDQYLQKPNFGQHQQKE